MTTFATALTGFRATTNKSTVKPRYMVLVRNSDGSRSIHRFGVRKTAELWAFEYEAPMFCNYGLGWVKVK